VSPHLALGQVPGDASVAAVTALALLGAALGIAAGLLAIAHALQDIAGALMEHSDRCFGIFPCACPPEEREEGA
jgi:hypothetical protein